MEKLKKIPVIGYLIRLLVAIVKLPKHIDEIYEIQKSLSERLRLVETQQDDLYEKLQKHLLRIEQLERLFNQLSEHAEQIRNQTEELINWNSDRMNEIRGLQQSDDELRRRIDSIYDSIEELHRWNSDRMEDIRKLEILDVDKGYFEKLNNMLSIHKTYWGPEERLHISNLATVDSCFFNTNSGNIVIGDYTFAGSNVSILAGSHDKRLKGFLRRDAEMTDGCDIEIGRGVWLASDCTILGPVTIGDNAVVAAGAVVVPGTHIPDNAVYAGVPAKQIEIIKLSETEDKHDKSILEAVQRNQGLLFVDGWTEKCLREYDGVVHQGHIINGERAVLYTTKKSIRMSYKLEKALTAEIQYKIDGNDYHMVKIDKKSGVIQMEVCDDLQCENLEIHVLTIEVQKQNNATLFLTQEL